MIQLEQKNSEFEATAGESQPAPDQTEPADAQQPPRHTSNYRGSRGAQRSRGGHGGNQYRAKQNATDSYSQQQAQPESLSETPAAPTNEAIKVRTVINKNTSSPQQSQRGGIRGRGARGGAFASSHQERPARAGYPQKEFSGAKELPEETRPRNSKPIVEEQQYQKRSDQAHPSTTKGGAPKRDPRAAGPSSGSSQQVRPQPSGQSHYQEHQGQRHANPHFKGKQYLGQKQHQSAAERGVEERYPTGGVYDKNGFYVYANGSFVDPNGYFFDQGGYDEFGGYYDSKNRYHQGPPPYKQQPPRNELAQQAAPDRPIENSKPQGGDYWQGEDSEHGYNNSNQAEREPHYYNKRGGNYPPNTRHSEQAARPTRGGHPQPPQQADPKYRQPAALHHRAATTQDDQEYHQPHYESKRGQTTEDESAHEVKPRGYRQDYGYTNSSGGADRDSAQEKHKIMARGPGDEPEIISHPRTRGTYMNPRGGSGAPQFRGSRGGTQGSFRGGHQNSLAFQQRSEDDQRSNFEHQPPRNQKPWHANPQGQNTQRPQQISTRGGYSQNASSHQPMHRQNQPAQDQENQSAQADAKEPIIIERRGTRGRGAPPVQIGARQQATNIPRISEQNSEPLVSYPLSEFTDGQVPLTVMKSSSLEFEPNSTSDLASDEQVKIDEDLAAARLQKQQANQTHLKYLAEQQRIMTLQQKESEKNQQSQPSSPLPISLTHYPSATSASYEPADTASVASGSFDHHQQHQQQLQLSMQLQQQQQQQQQQMYLQYQQQMFNQQMQQQIYFEQQYQQQQNFNQGDDNGDQDHTEHQQQIQHQDQDQSLLDQPHSMEQQMQQQFDFDEEAADHEWDQYNNQIQQQQQHITDPDEFQGSAGSQEMLFQSMNLQATPFVPPPHGMQQDGEADELEEYNYEAYQQVIGYADQEGQEHQ